MCRRSCLAAASIGVLLHACSGSDAQAQSPIEVSGEIEAAVISRKLPSDDRQQLISQALAYTHVSSYLWQPWIATLSADFNAAFEANPKGEFAEATNVAGSFVISGLPSSRYPFQLFFSASDNRFDGDYSGLDYTRMRAGLSGRALINDRSSFDYLVSHDKIDRVNYGNLSADRAEFTLRQGFNASDVPFSITDIGMSLSYYNTDFKSARGDPDNASESLAGTMFYRAAPTDSINHDVSTTLISDNYGNKQDRFDRLLGQTVGTLQWRSPSNDVTATSAVRMMAQKIDHRFAQEKSDTDSALVAASAGLSWRPTDQLTMTFGARATVERIQTIFDDQADGQSDALRSNYAGGFLGAVDYRSLAKEWAGFNWHWDARAAGDFGFDRNRIDIRRYEALYGPRSDATATIGHTIGRAMTLPWIETISFSLVQEAGFAHYSYAEDFQPIVTHGASFMKGFSDEQGLSYFRLYLRDNHSFGDRPLEYQTAQFDFTRQMQLSGNQRLQGSLGVQVVHQQHDDRDQAYFFPRSVYTFARGDIEYEYRGLFGVSGLAFLSNLRINALKQTDLAYDWRDELSPELFRNDWRNRVQYQIGKLLLSLEGTTFQVDDKLGHYVRLSGRRSFDFVD